jgi:hypothetical protein
MDIEDPPGRNGTLEYWNVGMMLKIPEQTAEHESTKFSKHEERYLSQRHRER